MQDERWIAVADRGAQVLRSFIDTLGSWLFWDIRPILVLLLIGALFLLVGYLRGDLREDKE